jgi:hypothetical protein
MYSCCSSWCLRIILKYVVGNCIFVNRSGTAVQGSSALSRGPHTHTARPESYLVNPRRRKKNHTSWHLKHHHSSAQPVPAMFGSVFSCSHCVHVSKSLTSAWLDLLKVIYWIQKSVSDFANCGLLAMPSLPKCGTFWFCDIVQQSLLVLIRVLCIALVSYVVTAVIWLVRVFVTCSFS